MKQLTQNEILGLSIEEFTPVELKNLFEKLSALLGIKLELQSYSVKRTHIDIESRSISTSVFGLFGHCLSVLSIHIYSHNRIVKQIREDIQPIIWFSVNWRYIFKTGGYNESEVVTDKGDLGLYFNVVTREWDFRVY